MKLFMMLAPMMIGCESGGATSLDNRSSCEKLCDAGADYCNSDYGACLTQCPAMEQSGIDMEAYTDCIIDTNCSSDCANSY
jgi:hypothetical protein